MKSLREVMDGMDWSGWATKPHGTTQLPRPTADNYSRPAAHALSGAEGDGMSEKLTTSKLTMRLECVGRECGPNAEADLRAHIAALQAEVAAAEARGFARARERAAQLLAADPMAVVREMQHIVRAMQDEGAGEGQG